MDIAFILWPNKYRNFRLDDVLTGERGVSGTILRSIHIPSELQKKGHTVSLYYTGLEFERDADLSVRYFKSNDDLVAALSRTSHDHIIWFFHRLEDISAELGKRYCVWLSTGNHLRIGNGDISPVHAKNLTGVIFVSATQREDFRHFVDFNRFYYIHNPIPSHFMSDTHCAKSKRPSLLFVGHLSEVKGAHSLLQVWRLIRRESEDITLTVVGGRRLYGSDYNVGSFGLAAPEFEEAYIKPLVREFGSLDAANIHFAGVLHPKEMLSLFGQTWLGIVNMNWFGSLETFCQSGTQMLANGLPVVSYARGALPETLGRSGGAFLLRNPDIQETARAILDLLSRPDELSQAGERGRRFALENYNTDKIVSNWEALLTNPDEYRKTMELYPDLTRTYRSLAKDVVRQLGKVGLQGAFFATLRAYQCIARGVPR